MKRFAIISSMIVIAVAGASFIAQAESGLSAQEARKLIARVAGIELSSDAVRVKSVSALGSSAVAVAQVETAFRFVKGESGKWRIAEVRTGDNKWEDIGLIMRALGAEKTARARAELETIATALEAFRRERGFYVVAESEKVLADHLSPRYLARVIRLDPWHRPYKYDGMNERFILRSMGSDGVENTPDDIVIKR